MEKRKQAEKSRALIQDTRALCFRFYNQSAALVSQSPDDKHEKRANHLRALHQQAAENLAKTPLDSREKAYHDLRAAGWNLDKCEKDHETSYEAEWSAYNGELDECLKAFFAALNALRGASGGRDNQHAPDIPVNSVSSSEVPAPTMGSEPQGELRPQADARLSSRNLNAHLAVPDEGGSTTISRSGASGLMSSPTNEADKLFQPPQHIKSTLESNNKRQGDTELERKSKRPRTNPTIDFEDVYQDGRANTKHWIVAKESRHGFQYFIYRCDEHNEPFLSRNPRRTGIHHLRNKHRSEVRKKSTFKVVQRHFAIRVRNCTADLARMNNQAFEDELAKTSSSRKSDQKSRKEPREAEKAVEQRRVVDDGTTFDYRPGKSSGDDPDAARTRENTQTTEDEIAVRSSSEDDSVAFDIAEDDTNDHDWIDHHGLGEGSSSISKPTSIRETLMVTLRMPQTPRDNTAPRLADHGNECPETVPALKMNGEYSGYLRPSPFLEEGADGDDERLDGDDNAGDDELQIIDGISEQQPTEVAVDHHHHHHLHHHHHQSWMQWASYSMADDGSIRPFDMGATHTQHAFFPIDPPATGYNGEVGTGYDAFLHQSEQIPVSQGEEGAYGAGTARAPAPMATMNTEEVKQEY